MDPLHTSHNAILPDIQKEPQKENSPLTQVWEETVLNASFTPKEILGSIIDFLDQKSVAILSRTKKSMNTLIRTSKSIQGRFLHEFAHTLLMQARKALATSDPFYNLSHLVRIAKTQIEIGAHKRAAETIILVEKEVLVFPYNRSKILTAIAEVQIELGDFEKAKNHLDEARKKARNTTHNYAELYDIVKIQITISMSTKSKDYLSEAKKTISLMTGDHLEARLTKAQALIDVAEAESTIGAIKEANETLLQAKELALLIGIEDGIHKFRCLIRIAKAKYTIGAIEEAKDTILGAKEIALLIKGCFKSTALEELVETLTQIGMSTKNREIFTQAKEIALLIENGTPQSFYRYLLKIAEAENTIGAIEDASETITKAKEIVSLIENDGARFFALLRLAEVQVKIDPFENTSETIAKAKETLPFKNDDYALTKLARVQMKIDAEATKETVAEIKNLVFSLTTDVEYKYRRLQTVAQIENEIGASEDAKKTLSKAKEEALLEKDPPNRIKRLKIVTEAQTEIGAFEEAKETIAQTKEAIFLISDIASTSCELVNASKTQVAIGDLEGAKKTLAQAKDVASLITRAYSQSEVLKKISEAQDNLTAIEVKIQAKEGNIVAVRKKLHETTLCTMEEHIAMAKKAIALANIVLKSPEYTS